MPAHVTGAGRCEHLLLRKTASEVKSKCTVPSAQRPRALKWRDYQQPHVVRHVGSVALLKPTPVST
jgi:hypothetical protein